MLTTIQRIKMLECPNHHIDAVMDTDSYNEIDDQFAISLALRSKEKINLKALYSAPFHNHRSVGPEDGMIKSYNETLKLLRLAGENSPVFKGAKSYLPDESHAIESPSSSHLAQLAQQYTPEFPLYVIEIAAITNVASAILMAPEIADRIVVVWLGGNALDWPHNDEFNCKQDVAAARVVLSCGCPLIMLPCLGVVSSFTTCQYELEHWFKGKNPLADYLQQQAIEEAHTYAKDKVWTRVIWDITAVGWLLNDDDRFMLSRYESTPIPQYDNHWSRDSRRPLCRYVYAIKRDALYTEMIEKICKR